MFFPFYGETKITSYMCGGAHYKRLKMYFPFRRTIYRRDVPVERRYPYLENLIEGVNNAHSSYAHIEVMIKDRERRGIFLEMQKYDEKTDRVETSFQKITEFPMHCFYHPNNPP